MPSRSDGSPAGRAIDDWLPVHKNETTVAWIERLRAMAANDGGYRGVSVSHLWTLAEDPRAPSSMRCGAALVLGSTDAGRDRLRVIATQIVDPAFSSLLDAIARQATARDLDDLVTRALSPQ